MQEQNEITFTKSVFFEGGGQTLKVSLTFQNCTEEDCKNLIPTIDVLISEMKSTLKN